MAKKLIHFDGSTMNLVCDESDCDYTGPLGEALTSSVIGKPCPDCGSNLMTERDFDSARKLFKLFDTVNKWLGWMGTETPTGNYKNISIHHHHGKTEIKELT